MIKTFWLSFVDREKPEGQRFLGVVVVDVTEEDAAAAKEQFPLALPGAEWIAAATRKAWALQCNPGGEVASIELNPNRTRDIPRGRLLNQHELKRWAHSPTKEVKN